MLHSDSAKVYKTPNPYFPSYIKYQLFRDASKGWGSILLGTLETPRHRFYPSQVTLWSHSREIFGDRTHSYDFTGKKRVTNGSATTISSFKPGWLDTTVCIWTLIQNFGISNIIYSSINESRCHSKKFSSVTFSEYQILPGVDRGMLAIFCAVT